MPEVWVRDRIIHRALCSLCLVLANPRSRIRCLGSCAPQRSLHAIIGVAVCVVRDATVGAMSSKCVPKHRA